MEVHNALQRKLRIPVLDEVTTEGLSVLGDEGLHSAGEYEFSWFIEIDCDTESSPTIQRKCHAYLDYRRTGIEQEERQVFPRVLWVAPDNKRAKQLQRAISAGGQLPVAMFAVTTSDNALRELTAAATAC